MCHFLLRVYGRCVHFSLLASLFHFHLSLPLHPPFLPAATGGVQVSLEQQSYTTFEGAGSVEICAVIVTEGFPFTLVFNLLVSTQDGSASECNIVYSILYISSMFYIIMQSSMFYYAVMYSSCSIIFLCKVLHSIMQSCIYTCICIISKVCIICLYVSYYII